MTGEWRETDYIEQMRRVAAAGLMKPGTGGTGHDGIEEKVW